MSTLLHYIFFINISFISFFLFINTQVNHNLISNEKKEQFLNPIKKKDFKYISSRYGWRIHPLTGKWQFHKGIDIVSYHKDAKVYSTKEGKVSTINYDPNQSSGLWIEIDHLNGYKTKYAHLNKIYIAQGEKVRQGQCIGIIGKTGKVSGNHLHYEVIHNGKNRNPLEI